MFFPVRLPLSPPLQASVNGFTIAFSCLNSWGREAICCSQMPAVEFNVTLWFSCGRLLPFRYTPAPLHHKLLTWLSERWRGGTLAALHAGFSTTPAATFPFPLTPGAGKCSAKSVLAA